MLSVPSLKLNKATSHIAFRPDNSIDLTAIRIGKQRVARKRDERLSDLKQAIIKGRELYEGVQNQESTAGEPTELHRGLNPNYMDHCVSIELDEIAFVLLKELGRLQAKGKDQPAEKQYKYKKFIVGFREVERALRRDELRGVIVATNLEEVDQLDCMVTKLHFDCKVKQVPLHFALNRRRIGKALGKSMKQSLVGILNLDGVHQEWKRMLSISESLRNTSQT